VINKSGFVIFLDAGVNPNSLSHRRGWFPDVDGTRRRERTSTTRGGGRYRSSHSSCAVARVSARGERERGAVNK